MSKALELNATLSHYRIASKIGAGGMGEVYRATDTRLKRDVAIKVLPESFALDEERITRFEREAQVLASLNHPNIAAIYGLEEADGIRALVMELVEGPTLADRIAASPIPLDEALLIAKQIVDALEVAHDRGIIHRDLKPANVKVTPDDKVKVLDFGLAKIASQENKSSDLSHSPTVIQGTQAGVILGTAAYMSPEQAKGKFVDKRADIWAFGCVLFEMLSGKQVFSGETLTDTLAAVVRAEPNWDDLPANTPNSIRHLLSRCLAKDPKQRLRDIGDARFEMEPSTAGYEARVSNAPGGTRWRAPLAIGLLLIATFAGGALVNRWLSPHDSLSPTSVARLIHTIPKEHLPSGHARNRLAISPDGKKLVYVANNRLYLRSLNALDAVELQGTEDAQGPFFSPDGEWVGFLSGQLKKVPVNGGQAVAICAINVLDALGASWGSDNTILFGGIYKGIFRVSANGGDPAVVVKPSASLSYANPQFLPDGQSFLYQRGAPGDQDELVIRSLDKNDDTVLLTGGYDYQFLGSGYLVYAMGARGQDLSAVAFDVASRKIVGNPVTVVRGVKESSSGSSSNFAVSASGTLIYLPTNQGQSQGTRLAVVDRSGKASVLATEARDFSDPRVSPDARSVAVHLQGDQNDVWVTDVARGTLTRLSYAGGEDETPAWSPDGRTVAWAAARADLLRAVYRRPIDGSGSEELVCRLENHCHVRDWSPDGHTLILEIQGMGFDIWRLNLQGNASPTVFLQTPFNERNSRLSPNGRWLAYVSDESGRDEVYVQAFPNGGSKLQVSSSGADQPVWSRDGRFIFFRGGGMIQETAFQEGAVPVVRAAKALFPDRFETPQAGAHTGYDVFPDGRFLMIQSQAQPGVLEEIIVVMNWIEELKQQVTPAAR
jgi:serine/threonine protein kinase/Tol biopolymer transport system component